MGSASVEVDVDSHQGQGALSPGRRRAASRAQIVAKQIEESARLVAVCGARMVPDLITASNLLKGALAAGGRVLVCGNGGSAAQAQHFVAELVGRLGEERGPLAGLCLNSDCATLTALANDYGFENIFARQLHGLCSAGNKGGDVLVVFSTSGRSPNILSVLKAAKELGVPSVAFLGATDVPGAATPDVSLCVPSTRTARIQEAHLVLSHSLCALVEDGSHQAV